MVDIFRKSSDIDILTNDILKIKPSTIWLQIGVINCKIDTLAKKHKINEWLSSYETFSLILSEYFKFLVAHLRIKIQKIY